MKRGAKKKTPARGVKAPGVRKAPIMAKRFVAATGSPFTDDDAGVIGVELTKIAEGNRVGDIRSLDKHLVFEAIEADPDHPLRRFYDWDVEKAARRHWLARTGLLIRSVRIITAAMPKREKPRPMFLYDPEHAKRSPGEKTKRGHVLTEDVLHADPVFASALASQIRGIGELVARLEHVTSMRPTPREVVTLRDSLRAALNEYLGAISTANDQAAE